jgi:hypothetical protein
MKEFQIGDWAVFRETDSERRRWDAPLSKEAAIQLAEVRNWGVDMRHMTFVAAPMYRPDLYEEDEAHA